MYVLRKCDYIFQFFKSLNNETGNLQTFKLTKYLILKSCHLSKQLNLVAAQSIAKYNNKNSLRGIYF